MAGRKAYRLSVGGTAVKRADSWSALLIEFTGLAQRGYRPVVVENASLTDGALYGGVDVNGQVTVEWRTSTSTTPEPDWALGFKRAFTAQRGTT